MTVDELIQKLKGMNLNKKVMAQYELYNCNGFSFLKEAEISDVSNKEDYVLIQTDISVQVED